MVEYYLADLSRRGDIDARSLRVPGTLPRPRLPDRAFSPAFGSNLFHAVAAGETFDCPVSPEATLWALSLRCCIDNLLHAARLSNGTLPRQRVWTLPALHVSMGELFEALVARIGPHARDLVQWRPDPSLELALGRFPELQTSKADWLGFRHDGDVESLMTNVISELQ